MYAIFRMSYNVCCFFEYFMTTSQREITNKLLFVLQFKKIQSHSPKFTEHSRSIQELVFDTKLALSFL